MLRVPPTVEQDDKREGKVLHRYNDIVVHSGSGIPEDESAVTLERLVFRLRTWTHQAHMNGHDAAILSARATGRSRQPFLCTFEAGQLRSRRTCP